MPYSTYSPCRTPCLSDPAEPTSTTRRLSLTDGRTVVEAGLPGSGGRTEAGAANNGAPPPPGGDRLILLVDDEPAVRESTRRVLARLGYRVLVAGSAKQALAVYGDHRQSIDLLFTDVVMPAMSGGELAERLRQLEPSLPVLFMSGHADGIFDPREPLPAGGFFLAKPFEPRGLLAAVRRALAAGAIGLSA